LQEFEAATFLFCRSPLQPVINAEELAEAAIRAATAALERIGGGGAQRPPPRHACAGVRRHADNFKLNDT